jgi:hypothetical protein
MRRFVTVLPATCVAAIAWAGTALAAPPVRFHDEDPGSEEPGFITCDGFVIDLATGGTEDFTVYVDDSGEVVKVLVRNRATDVFTNSVSGKTVVNRGVFQQLFVRIGDTDEFTHSLTGYRFMATSPGRGVVLQDVGRIEYVGDEEDIVFLAGQHHVPDGPEAEEAFCAALS